MRISTERPQPRWRPRRSIRPSLRRSGCRLT